jgi:hypothetical protein
MWRKLIVFGALCYVELTERIKRMPRYEIKSGEDAGNIWAHSAPAEPVVEPVFASADTITILTAIMDPWEWEGIAQAALCEHTDDPEKAEQYRALIGYGGLDAR